MNHEKVHSTIFFRKGKTNSKLGSRLTEFSSAEKTPECRLFARRGRERAGFLNGSHTTKKHSLLLALSPRPGAEPRGRAKEMEAAPRAGMSASVRAAPRADERPPASPGVAPCGHASELPPERKNGNAFCVCSELLSSTPLLPAVTSLH